MDADRLHSLRPARVLILTSDAFGGHGGMARFNRHLIRALSRAPEFETQALGLHGDATVAAPDGIAWRVPAASRKIAFSRAALAEALRLRPHLLINGFLGFSPLAAALRTVTRARLWTVTHGIEIWQPPPWWKRTAFLDSDLVTAVSRYTRDRLLSWCEIPAERVFVLPNTIDLERFRPGPRPPILTERHRPDGRPVLLTVSRLSAAERYKGHDRVIRLLPRLVSRLGPVLYLIVGDGDDRPRLEELVKRTGVEEHVVFTGRIPEAELRDYYRLADLFVMPSTGEGFGIVFLEAMACGCPVVAGCRDGSVDALAGGELGRLVDPLDEDDLLAGIHATLATGRQHDLPIAGVERFALPRFEEQSREIAERALGRPARTATS